MSEIGVKCGYGSKGKHFFTCSPTLNIPRDLQPRYDTKEKSRSESPEFFFLQKTFEPLRLS